MKFKSGDIVKHLKTGNLYIVEIDSESCRLEATNEPAYAYRRADGSDFRVWIRSAEKMEDGRFEINENSN